MIQSIFRLVQFWKRSIIDLIIIFVSYYIFFLHFKLIESDTGEEGRKAALKVPQPPPKEKSLTKLHIFIQKITKNCIFGFTLEI